MITKGGKFTLHTQCHRAEQLIQKAVLREKEDSFEFLIHSNMMQDRSSNFPGRMIQLLAAFQIQLQTDFKHIDVQAPFKCDKSKHSCWLGDGHNCCSASQSLVKEGRQCHTFRKTLTKYYFQNLKHEFSITLTLQPETANYKQVLHNINVLLVHTE